MGREGVHPTVTRGRSLRWAPGTTIREIQRAHEQADRGGRTASGLEHPRVVSLTWNPLHYTLHRQCDLTVEEICPWMGRGGGEA